MYMPTSSVYKCCFPYFNRPLQVIFPDLDFIQERFKAIIKTSLGNI